MNQTEIENAALTALGKCGAIRQGHFVYTKGGHGELYVAKDLVFTYPAQLLLISQLMADKVMSYAPEVLIAPAVGGIGFVGAVGVELHKRGMPVRIVFAEYGEKKSDGLVIKRGYEEIIANKKVCTLEDIVNSGGSLTDLIAVTTSHGGIVENAVAICNRGTSTGESLGVQNFEVLINLSEQSTVYEAKECPYCQKNIPVNTDFGHGQEFLDAQAKQHH